MKKTIAYLRVSTNDQDLNNQKFEILKYCQSNDIHISTFIEIEISSRKTIQKRRITELMEGLNSGDRVVVSELSRLGRSTVEVLSIINAMISNKVELHAIKQNIRITDNQDIQSKIIVTLFSLFAELERDLISQRTKSALQAKRAAGIKLGRPKGSLGKSVLDGKEELISDFLRKKVSITSIAKILEVSRGTVQNFVNSRHLIKS